MTWQNEFAYSLWIYIGFIDGQDPDQDYIDAAIPVLEYRMMIGARRLAETIKDIYSVQ